MIREDDPQFRITPFQQMASACSGALITSLFSKFSKYLALSANYARTPIDILLILRFVALIVTLFPVTPLDVVKIRLQAQQKALLSNKCYLYCNGLMEHLCPCGEAGWMPRRVHFHGTIDAFCKITKLEGVAALWSGLSPTLVLAVPCTVIYFVTYEQLRYKSKTMYNNFTNTTHQPMWIPLLSGATARTIAVTIVSPLELIRTKMQSRSLTYPEINAALKQVVKYEGYRGLFRGLGSTLLRDVPFSAIYWTTYETTKRMFRDTDSEKNTFLFNFICGSIAGSIAAFITLPFDVVKTHQQIELGEKEIYADTKTRGKVSNTQDIAKNIYANHGVRGLFTGLLPRIFKVAPACAIMISTFEYGKQFFQTYNTQQYRERMLRQGIDLEIIKSDKGE